MTRLLTGSILSIIMLGTSMASAVIASHVDNGGGIRGGSREDECESRFMVAETEINCK